MTQRIYLSLGSNLGDREGNLRAAVRALRGIMEIEKISSLYETAPVGGVDQDHFLNLALSGTTDLEPEELLQRVKAIEFELGRRPTVRWGPRVIDIDILLYDDRIVNGSRLTIPHPEMMRRAFVLAPLAEIAPEMRHPVSGESMWSLLEANRDQAVHKLKGFDPSPS